jgi:phage-related protein
MDAKKIIWEGTAWKDILSFPKSARRRAGYELDQVQNGREPSDWKPMTSVGAGVKEVRIHMEGQYRVIYVAKFSEGVYVLHAFQKKTQKTSTKDLEAAKQRYANLVKERRKK